MSNSINNNIPFVPENTIDPAAGLNEAINVIDAVTQVEVISLTVTAPPASPAVGDRYIVPTGATGAWAGQSGNLARWEEGLFWAFYKAQFVTNNGVAYTKTSGGWSPVSGSGEANTSSNLGTGEGIAAPKAGVNLPFKSLKAGANVTITSDANEITIAATGGGGGSSTWGGITGDIQNQADLQAEFAEKEQVLTAGANITIDRTNPAAPVISATGGGGGSGDVSGPASATDGAIALFDGVTGKKIKDGPLPSSFATAEQGELAETAVQEAPLDGDLYGRKIGAWAKVPAALSNPMTAAGEMIKGGVGGVPAKIPAGTAGQVLSYGASGPEWLVQILTKEYKSAELTLTVSGSINLTHDLGVSPKIIVGAYVCIAAEGGYSVGDMVHDPISWSYTDGGTIISSSASFNSTQIRIIFSQYLRVPNKTTGAIFNITPASWRYLVSAFA